MKQNISTNSYNKKPNQNCWNSNFHADETDDGRSIENDPEPDILVLCSSPIILKTTYHY